MPKYRNPARYWAGYRVISRQMGKNGRRVSTALPNQDRTREANRAHREVHLTSNKRPYGTLV